MKRSFVLLLSVLWVSTSVAQNVSEALKKAVKTMEADPQMRQAQLSIHVADANSGATVFAYNSQVGMVPASTLKLITSATAYALLGRDFRYQTTFGLVKSGSGTSLAIRPSGDPTLGSSRWNATREEAVLQRIVAAVRNSGTTHLNTLMVYNNGWNEEGIPNGWIWEDVGNYFGAGAYGLNWRENQFDLFLRSGNNVGDEVSVVGTTPKLYDYNLASRARAAAKGTGDRTLVYLPILSREGLVRGTIPAGEQRFKVSGALPNPLHQFAETLKAALRQVVQLPDGEPTLVLEEQAGLPSVLHTETSPTLDSIVYWLNQKSINLYAEALLRTMAVQKGKPAATEEGVSVIKAFWKTQGIAETELNMQDGSGLSPQNHITTRAQVAILVYAKKQPWYNGFYASLPLYNGMKMKSGTIGGVKGFSGYHTAKSGTTYAFSILVNNHNGSSSAITQKIYSVLNELK